MLLLSFCPSSLTTSESLMLATAYSCPSVIGTQDTRASHKVTTCRCSHARSRPCSLSDRHPDATAAAHAEKSSADALAALAPLGRKVLLSSGQPCSHALGWHSASPAAGPSPVRPPDVVTPSITQGPTRQCPERSEGPARWGWAAGCGPSAGWRVRTPSS
jgi:hypothetical protein